MSTQDQSTRERLAAMIAEAGHPPTISDAAEALSVSRQRISQLYKSMGLVMPRGRRSKPLTAAGREVQTLPQTAAPSARLAIGGRAAALTTNAAGHVSELIAAADLIARGFSVLAPIAQTTAPVDLVTVSRQSGRVERIEVRSGTRRNGKVSWTRSGGARRTLCDRYAIVLAGEPVRYSPPFDGDELVEYIAEMPRS